MTALDGIRVLDLTQFEAGPSCTELLAFMGADVIKVEDPRRGDQGRRMATDTPGDDSYYFILLNLNKRSITLNLKSDEGREIFKRLVPRFDVLIENYSLGTLDRWGLGWDVLKELHPPLVYASIRGFGDSGRYAPFRAFDMVAQASGGAMSVNGDAGGPPLKLGVTLGDTGAGIHCAAGILAGYIQRLRTGVGTRVEVSMQEAVMNYTRVAMLTQYMSGQPVERRGNRLAYMSADLYRCSPAGPNDYVYMAISNAEMWDGILKTIGRTDLVGHEEWSNVWWRMSNFDDVHAVVEAWTSERDKYAVMEAFGDNGVPCGAVLDTMELMRNEHLRGRGAVVTIEHPGRGTIDVPASPIRLGDAPADVTRSPLLGEHNADVYGELLGLRETELDELKGRGVL